MLKDMPIDKLKSLEQREFRQHKDRGKSDVLMDRGKFDMPKDKGK